MSRQRRAPSLSKGSSQAVGSLARGNRRVQLGRGIILALVGLGVVWFAHYVATEKAHDFRVFYSMAVDLRGGNTDLYGPHGVMSWPMIYRYPPWFSIVLVPWSLIRFGVAAFLWTGLKFLTLWLVVRAVLRMLRKGKNRGGDLIKLGWFWLIPILIATPSLIEEFESGNVHFFVFAATVAALYNLPRRTLKTAWYFAAGIGVKLLPAFFLPYLVLRRDSPWVLFTILMLFLLFLLPIPVFGWQGNFELFLEWWGTSGFGYLSGREPVFPLDYSLTGIMTRYLSSVDYSSLPDSNYPNINLVRFSEGTVALIGAILSLAGYAGLLWLAWRLRLRGGRSEEPNLENGLLFCAMLLLSPAVQKIHFVVILFPAIVIGYELRSQRLSMGVRKGVWVLTAASLLLFAVPPLIPGAAQQRLVDVYSPMYVGTLCLALVLAILLRDRYRSSTG